MLVEDNGPLLLGALPSDESATLLALHMLKTISSLAEPSEMQGPIGYSDSMLIYP